MLMTSYILVFLAAVESFVVFYNAYFVEDAREADDLSPDSTAMQIDKYSRWVFPVRHYC